MTSHGELWEEISPFPVFCMPNAGLPNEDGEYDESPQDMGVVLKQFADQGWLNVVGGCGTNHDYIAHFNEIRSSFSPRELKYRRGSYVSGIEFLEIDEDSRPILVGERTNIIGSRKFKKMIINNKWEEAAEIGRKQIKGGVKYSMCLANPDRDEKQICWTFYPKWLKKLKHPS